MSVGMMLASGAMNLVGRKGWQRHGLWLQDAHGR